MCRRTIIPTVILLGLWLMYNKVLKLLYYYYFYLFIITIFFYNLLPPISQNHCAILPCSPQKLRSPLGRSQPRQWCPGPPCPTITAPNASNTSPWSPTHCMLHMGPAQPWGCRKELSFPCLPVSMGRMARGSGHLLTLTVVITCQLTMKYRLYLSILKV